MNHRKVLLAIAGTLLLASCSKNLPEPVSGQMQTSDGVLLKLAVNTPVNVTTATNGQPIKVIFTKSTAQLYLAFSKPYFTDEYPKAFNHSNIYSTTRVLSTGQPVSYPPISVSTTINKVIYNPVTDPIPTNACLARIPTGYSACAESLVLNLESLPNDTYYFIFYPNGGKVNTITTLSTTFNVPL